MNCTVVFFSHFCVAQDTLLRYLFRLVQLVYHGSSHSILHMFTACCTRYLQPFH